MDAALPAATKISLPPQGGSSARAFSTAMSPKLVTTQKWESSAWETVMSPAPMAMTVRAACAGLSRPSWGGMGATMIAASSGDKISARLHPFFGVLFRTKVICDPVKQPL